MLQSCCKQTKLTRGFNTTQNFLPKQRKEINLSQKSTEYNLDQNIS